VRLADAAQQAGQTSVAITLIELAYHAFDCSSS
jgi:hypothetical protein